MQSPYYNAQGAWIPPLVVFAAAIALIPLFGLVNADSTIINWAYIGLISIAAVSACSMMSIEFIGRKVDSQKRRNTVYSWGWVLLAAGVVITFAVGDPGPVIFMPPPYLLSYLGGTLIASLFILDMKKARQESTE